MNDDVDQLCRTIKTLVAEGDKAKAEAEQFYIAARRVLACSSRGATTDAACDCGVDYVPAGARAAKAVAEHPEKSDRALAAEAGVTDKTIRRARKKSTADLSAVQKRIGKDGKARRVPTPEEQARINAKAKRTREARWERVRERSQSAVEQPLEWPFIVELRDFAVDYCARVREQRDCLDADEQAELAARVQQCASELATLAQELLAPDKCERECDEFDRVKLIAPPMNTEAVQRWLGMRGVRNPALRYE